MSTDFYVHGAVYLRDSTGERAILEGLRAKCAVVRWEHTLRYEYVPHGEFRKCFSDTGEHDHEAFCCDGHGTHAIPHRGCLLR